MTFITPRLVDSAFGGGDLVVSTAGVTAGELLVVFVDTDAGGAPSATGWTEVNVTSVSGSNSTWIFVKDDLGPGDATYTFSIGSGADGAVHLMAITTDGTNLKFDNANGTSATSTSMVAPSIVADTVTSVLLCFWMLYSGTDTSSITEPISMTELISNVRSNGWGHRSIFYENVTSGSTGTRTSTASDTYGHISSSITFSVAAGDQDLDIPFHQQITSIFTPTISNQDALNLTPSRLESSVQFFNPTIENQSALTLSPARLESGVQLFTPTLTGGEQHLHPERIESTVQLFVPIVQLQSSLELDVGFLDSSLQLFVLTIENQANLNLNVPFRTFTATLFNPTVFNEGDELFEPTLVGNGSLADQIMAGLIDQGFLTGTLADREYNRLLNKLTLSVGDNFSIADLYRLADEDNRIAGLEVPA